jgi:CheY-like chemotaxis protein
MPEDRERCLAAGANDYLSKPVGLKKLTQTIKIYLEAAKISREFNVQEINHGRYPSDC